MRIAVITGSRRWTDPHPIADALLGADGLIVGDATGADQLALMLALESDVIPYVYCASPKRADQLRAMKRAIGVTLVCDWRVLRGKAGSTRNAAMVARAQQERHAGVHVTCHAFPLVQSVGTWDCVRQLEDAGFTVAITDAA